MAQRCLREAYVQTPDVMSLLIEFRSAQVANITPLFYLLGSIGTVQFGLLMWVHMKHLGFAGLNPLMLVPLVCRAAS